MVKESSVHRSLLTTEKLSRDDILSIFNLATRYKDFKFEKRSEVAALIFLEPSTRTRMSFEMAALRLGLSVVKLDDLQSSSVSKGESFHDTILNVCALKPEVLIVRDNGSHEVRQALAQVSMPVISGGSGMAAHPTQGLLDAYTLFLEWGDLKNREILFVGDISQSRVFQSTADVFHKLGCRLSVSAPKSLLPEESFTEKFSLKTYPDLKDGLMSANAVIGLRHQFERAEDVTQQRIDLKSYQLNLSTVKFLKADAIIMHPGPVRVGEEMTADVMQHPQSRILKQVELGVLIRMAVLSRALGFKEPV